MWLLWTNMLAYSSKRDFWAPKNGLNSRIVFFSFTTELDVAPSSFADDSYWITFVFTNQHAALQLKKGTFELIKTCKMHLKFSLVCIELIVAPSRFSVDSYRTVAFMNQLAASQFKKGTFEPIKTCKIYFKFSLVLH